MNKDKISGLFWLCFGLLTMEEPYRLSLGTVREPGGGFHPLWVGLGVAVLSFITLIQSFRKRVEKYETEDSIWYINLFWVIFALIIYALLLEQLGFLVCTFLLIFSLVRAIESEKWWVVFLTSSLGSFLARLFFGVWLKIQLPKGIFLTNLFGDCPHVNHI